MAKQEEEKKCDCSHGCDCENDCCCDENHKCNEECDCENEEKCCHGKDNHIKHCKKNSDEGFEEKSNDNHSCDCEKESCDECSCKEENHEKDSNDDYLALARQIQADFENFRRHAIEDIKQAKIAGQASVIEVFLPCLDTFKEAKKSINDQEILKGVEMIENKIIDALKNLGVEKIESVGEKYNPHVHNVIAVLNVADKENDVIVDEYQAGYTFNGKVIRYAKVIVNKKEG